jgi:hypothetical protein
MLDCRLKIEFRRLLGIRRKILYPKVTRRPPGGGLPSGIKFSGERLIAAEIQFSSGSLAYGISQTVSNFPDVCQNETGKNIYATDSENDKLAAG